MNAMILAAVLSGFVDVAAASRNDSTDFTLNLAQVQWTRTATDEQPLGFALGFMAGDDTDGAHDEDSLRHIDQASLSYRWRNGVTIDAGVYSSHIGFESFHSKDDWNATRGLLAQSTPYFATGVKVSYAFDAHWSGQLHALRGRTAGTQIAYSNGPLSASFNTLIDADRKLGDVVVVYRVSPQLQLAGSFDAGRDEDASWSGGALFARYAFNDRHAVAVRAEQFETSREATLTYELRPREHFILKLETRQDRGEFLAVAGAVVTF